MKAQTTEVVTPSLPNSNEKVENANDDESTENNVERQTFLTNGIGFNLGPDVWNPAESILFPQFPEIEEKIKCIDFGIHDYLSKELKESDEDSSGSGDFNNGLNVEPQSLFVETDLESPLPTLDGIMSSHEKKSIMVMRSGFLRGGSNDSSTLAEDVGPTDSLDISENQDENDSNTDSDGSFSPVDSTLGSLEDRDADDVATLESLERELGQLTGQEKVDTEDIVNRLLRLNSQELAFMDPQQVDAALSISEDVGQGSGLSSPMSESDEDAKMVQTLK